MCPWEKKPDVELVDPTGELLTIYLDITLPALHQEAIKSRTAVFTKARCVKNKSYPRKDQSGRLLTESSCIPFILTSMGGLCDEGHEFLRVCRKRNPEKTKHLVDVLVTQHSKWIAGKIRRALFGQTPTFQPTSENIGQKPHRNCGHMQRLKSAFSNSETTANIEQDIVEIGEIFPLSPK